MDDQLDNDLKKRIREVFDNYDDEHADAGWLRLREKYPEKAKRRAVAWLWYGSVAALVLIFLGIFLFRQAPVKKEKLVASKQHPVNPAPKNPGKENNIKDNGKADSVINSLQKRDFANNNAHPGHSHTNSFNKTSQLPVVPSVSNKQSGIVMVNKSKNDTASKELVAANKPKTQDQHITANNAG